MHCLVIFDFVYSSFIVTPLVILFWAPLWELMARQPDWFSPFWVLYVSAALLIAVALVRDLCVEMIRDTLPGRIFTWSFVYVCSCCGIMFWRSLWGLEDEFLTRDWTICELLVSLVILILINAQRTLIFVPFLVEPDGYANQIYMFPTIFNISSSESTWIYTIDCVVTVCGVGSLVVSVWRSVWYLLDLYIYPKNANESALASITTGYAIVAVAFVLQPLMKHLERTLNGFFRLVIIDIYQLLSFFGSLNVWRGIWILLNTHVLPERPDLSYFLVHIISYLLLVLINSSKSLMARGVANTVQKTGRHQLICNRDSSGKCFRHVSVIILVNYNCDDMLILLKEPKNNQSSTRVKEDDGLVEEAAVGLRTATENPAENESKIQDSNALGETATDKHFAI